MTSLFQARRRAEDFAAVVDGPAERRAASGDDLAPLLELVGALRGQPPVEPRAGFTADLRSRLMLEAETALRPETANLLLPVREPGRRERRLVAAASAFVLIGGTTTMAAAAQSSLPGDALYPIKRGIERAEVSLSLSAAGKGEELLSHASDRLVEVQGLVDASGPSSAPRVPETLTAFSAAAEEGSALLFESFRETADPEAILIVRTFAAEGVSTLKALAADVPADAQDELVAAAMLLGAIDGQAAGLCDTCAPDLAPLDLPGIFLARAEVDRALALAATRELDNDHPVVVSKDAVQAVRRATGMPYAPETAETPAPDATASPAPALPSPTSEPESWPSLLPDLQGDGDTTTKSDSTIDKTTEEVEEGLTGVVETLLPDPSGSLLD
jgi:hypothetical protein